MSTLSFFCFGFCDVSIDFWNCSIFIRFFVVVVWNGKEKKSFFLSWLKRYGNRIIRKRIMLLLTIARTHAHYTRKTSWKHWIAMLIEHHILWCASLNICMRACVLACLSLCERIYIMPDLFRREIWRRNVNIEFHVSTREEKKKWNRIESNDFEQNGWLLKTAKKIGTWMWRETTERDSGEVK